MSDETVSFVPAQPPKLSLASAAFRQRATLRWRFVRAYWTTFVVIGSYLWASFGRRVFGERWHAERIADVHRANAVRVERTIIALQGLFIKVGQLLSIMANFLPDEFRSGLSGLQDQVPPRPFSEIEARIRGDLGKSTKALFGKLEKKPIASGSLGQVHEAWLKDGTHVVVKVQHQDIEDICRLDLATIRRILSIVNVFLPIQGMDQYYLQVKELIAEELDFELEAAHIDRIAQNFSHDDKVRFPKVITELSTKRVMTQTFVSGTKVSDIAALDALGIDRKELARRIVRVFCQMIFVDGVYHADPHPGNLLVSDTGELILIDFGAVAEVSKDMREGMPEFLEGVIRRDTERLTKSLRRMGFLSASHDGDVSEKVIEYFHQRFQDQVKIESLNLSDIKIDPQRGLENLVDLARMDVTLKELSGAFHVPRDWVVLQRAFLLLTGVCTELDPTLNPIEVVRPYLQEFVLGSRDWTQIAIEAVRDTAMSALSLPDDMRKYLQRAVRGELEVNVRGLQDGTRLIYRALRQGTYALLAVAGGYGALQLYLHGERRLASYVAGGAGAMLVLFFGSAIFTSTTLKR
jgi:predicted unusual protein kinase regulating ubiquinone biosynthesis (AarF/ABC1/UbiB family)